MNNGTLNQAAKILSVFEVAPREQIQAILEKGLLADLRDATNVEKMDRDEFRRMCGLKSLNPPILPLLEPVGTITIPALTGRFSSREKFVLNYGRKVKPGVRIAHLGDNLKAWFGEAVEEPTAVATLTSYRLTRSELDGPILVALGNNQDLAVFLRQIFWLMEQQPNGEQGMLLTGQSNIFYPPGLTRAVYVLWFAGRGGRSVSAYSVADPCRWYGGVQVFSRNSSVAVVV